MRREWLWVSLRVSLLTALFGAALAACSSDDVATSTTVALPTSTASSVPTTSTTSVPSTTVPSSTTTSITTAPTTTAAPPSTVTTTLPDGVPPRVTFPDDPEKQAVVDAAYAFFDAARAAQAAPDDAERRAQLAATMTDPIGSRLTAFLDELAVAGERIIASDNQPSYIDVFVETVSVVDASGLFDACVVDTDVRVARSDGTEIVLDDDVTSGVQTYSLERIDGSWVVRDFATVDSYPGQVGCG